MSYKQAVLRDNPIAFFPIEFSIRNYFYLKLKYSTYSALSSAFTTYSKINSSYLDETTNGGSLTLNGISGVSPIVSGNTVAALIGTSSLISISNKYKAFGKDALNNAFSGEFWFSFNNNLNGQNGKYDWAINNYQNNNSLNDGSTTNIDIFYIKNGSTVIGKIFYEKATNTIRFRVYGAGSSYQESYCKVQELDTQYHVCFTYSNKTINVSVNNHSGVSASITDISLFPTTSSSISYSIDGSTLKANESFLISNLAFYNYVLTSSQIRNHMVWAFNDDKPIKSYLSGQNNIFTFQDSQDLYSYRKIFIGKDFKKATEIYNLSVTDAGLSPKNLSNGFFNSLDSTPISYNATDGASWTGGKSGIDFSDFGLIATVPGTITMVVKPSVSTEYLLSIDGVNGNSTLYLERASGSYNLKYYDVENGGITTTLATVTNTSSYDKIGISFTPTSISLNVNGSSSTGSQTISFSRKSTLTVGQSYHLGKDLINLRANSSSFASLSITDEYRTSFPTSGSVSINNYSYTGGYPWTAVIKFFASMTNNLTMYQKGYWITSLPLSSVSNAIGSKVDWTSMNNCIVEYSTDFGSTWYSLPERGSHIPGFDFTGKLKNIMIRVTLVSNYAVSNYNQSFNELEVGIYKNLTFYSEGENFSITQQSRDTTYKSTYTTKLHSYPILSRPNNIGLFFAYDPAIGSVPGYAKINNLNSQSITFADFWIRPDSQITNAKLLTGDSAIAGYPDLYINGSGYLVYNSGITSLYVNGTLVSSGIFSPSANDLYHISVVMNPYSGNLFLNGTGSSAGLAGSYGHVNIKQYASNNWDVSSNYDLFIKNKVAVLANDNNMNLLSNQVLIDGRETYAIAHKIGS